MIVEFEISKQHLSWLCQWYSKLVAHAVKLKKYKERHSDAKNAPLKFVVYEVCQCVGLFSYSYASLPTGKAHIKITHVTSEKTERNIFKV